jgi:hypothetical protein
VVFGKVAIFVVVGRAGDPNRGSDTPTRFVARHLGHHREDDFAGLEEQQPDLLRSRSGSGAGKIDETRTRLKWAMPAS